MVRAALLLAIVLVAGFFYLKATEKAQITSPISLKNNLTYADSTLKFELEYPAEFEVVEETEEQYSERTKTKFRKNFNYYITYEPPKFVKGLVVKKKDTALTEDQFATVPFYLWIFENPDKLTVEKWYDEYWYYPYLWGVFDARKAQIEPAFDATVSGTLTKWAEISYSPGKPKLILLPASRGEPKDDKMFLFKIMEGGDKILESFKFL